MGSFRGMTAKWFNRKLSYVSGRGNKIANLGKLKRIARAYGQETFSKTPFLGEVSCREAVDAVKIRYNSRILAKIR